jgi:hypothetical protein
MTVDVIDETLESGKTNDRQASLIHFTYRRLPRREAAAADRLLESSPHIGTILLVH